MKKLTGKITAALKEIGSLLKSVWVDFGNSGPCCGIRFDRKETPCSESMPTPSSCCGVRV
jgi:hypothetical protein